MPENFIVTYFECVSAFAISSPYVIVFENFKWHIANDGTVATPKRLVRPRKWPSVSVAGSVLLVDVRGRIRRWWSSFCKKRPLRAGIQMARRILKLPHRIDSYCDTHMRYRCSLSAKKVRLFVCSTSLKTAAEKSLVFNESQHWNIVGSKKECK